MASTLSEATILLAVRGGDGRFGAPMKPAVAQALLDSVGFLENHDLFPRAALETAGCHLAKWDAAVRRGTIQFSEGQYSVPIDPPTNSGISSLIAKLHDWRDPEWHNRNAAAIQSLPANQR